VDAAFNNISIGFYVIAGAFKGEDNANNLTHKLRKTSYKDAISFKPEQYPLHLVAYGVKSSLEKAKATAERIKSSGRNVWIYAAN
jgi:cell division septation protein DedD